MLSTMAPAPVITRSSLEQMLDSIRQRDEQPKDVPPALPTRPVKRGRLPTARRSLPVDFKIGGNPPEYLPGDGPEKEEVKVGRPPAEDKEVGFRSGIFGSRSRRLSKVEEPGESPYAPETGSTEGNWEEAKGSEATVAPSPSTHLNESGCDAHGTVDCELKEQDGLLSLQVLQILAFSGVPRTLFLKRAIGW